MNILITGSGNYLGKYLINKFIINNINVIAISNKKIPKINKRFYFIKHQLSKSPYLKIKKKIDVMIHISGPSYKPENKIEDYISGNILSALNTDHMRKFYRPKVLFYTSTREIYGDISSSSLTEKTKRVEPGVYGMSKYIAEEIFMQNKPTIILRLPSIIGKGNHGWINKIYSDLKKNRNIKFFNMRYNNCVHLKDIYLAIKIILLKKNIKNNIYNMSCRDIVMSKSIIEIMKAKSKSKSKLIEKKINFNNNNYIISSKKIKSFFKPMSVYETINEYLNEMEKINK